MPALVIQVIQIYADLVIIIFVSFYFLKLWNREKELEKKESKIDTDYHHVVDNALAKERKIIDDATHEAEQIIAGAYYVNKASKDTVDQALQKMIADIQKDAINTAQEVMTGYQASLREVTGHSLTEFQNITKEEGLDLRKQIKAFHETLTESVTDFQTVAKGMEGDLQEQIRAFHETLLPAMEKELEEYKQTRMQQTDRTITHLVQKVAQEVLNKSIPLDDHQNLVLESLEKAKKEGAFN